MERQQKERKTVQHTTRNILDLPEVILIYIISLLPVKDAAKSTAVSKKWRDLWITIPDWTLDYNSFPSVVNKKDKFKAFVDRIIYFHQGPGIKSMKLHYNHGYDAVSIHTEGWIRHLVENNIVRLDISVYDPVQLPSSLFTSVALVELRLTLFFQEFTISGSVFLPNLKSLYIELTKFATAIQFERLINGCPILEDLHMKECYFSGPDFKQVTFSHPNVRSLNIDRCGGFDALKTYIRMPSLSEVKFKCVGLIDPAAAIDITSLNVAVLDIRESLRMYQLRTAGVLTASYGPNMSRILASICRTKKLSLSEWCIEYMSMILHNLKLVSSDELEYLDLKMWPNRGHSYVVTELLRCYPNLKFLTITFIDNNRGDFSGIFDGERKNYPQPPDILSAEMVPCNLKMLKIKGIKCYVEELRMLKFLVQKVADFEKFTVHIPRHTNQWTLKYHAAKVQELSQDSPVKPEINFY